MTDVAYLITGGAGNLPCQLTHVLGVPGGEIVQFDIASAPVADVAPGCVYVQGDVTNEDQLRHVLSTYKPRVVLHMASLLSGSSERDRRLAMRINVQGAMTLFELMVEIGLKSVLFPSSLATFGGILPDPLPEDQPQWPDGFYGVTKVACERLGVYYHRRHGLDFRCLRLPIVLSPHAPVGAASSYASRAFIEAVQNGRFVFNVRPTTRVSIMYVRDALRAITMLTNAPEEALSRRVYNVHAIAPLASEIASAIQRRIPDVILRFEPQPQVADLIESWPATIEDASSRTDWRWNAEYDLPRLADAFIEDLRV